jgi:hypothetical protein
MRPLSPPLTVIEDNLFGPSMSLLLRWVNNDPDLSPQTVKRLENDPVALEFAEDLKKQESAPVLEDEGMDEEAPPMPLFLKELIGQRIAARERYAALPVPRQGQILRIDQIVGPDGPIDWELSSPLAVLIDKQIQTKNLWQGWMVAPEADYASHWDMLLEIEDQPFDPLASMIQIWNQVPVYLPSEAPVLAELKPARLQAVHALADEFEKKPELDTSISRPGYVAPRTTFEDFSILTGTPINGKNDPRYRYKELYQEVAKILREVAASSFVKNLLEEKDLCQYLSKKKASEKGQFLLMFSDGKKIFSAPDPVIKTSQGTVGWKFEIPLEKLEKEAKVQTLLNGEDIGYLSIKRNSDNIQIIHATGIWENFSPPTVGKEGPSSPDAAKADIPSHANTVSREGHFRFQAANDAIIPIARAAASATYWSPLFVPTLKGRLSPTQKSVYIHLKWQKL